MESNISQIELVKDINTVALEGDYSSSIPSKLTKFNDRLYFVANNGEVGSELWVSDGTAEGTQIVADLRPNDSENSLEKSSEPSTLIEFGDRLYFSANAGETGTELWATDGTTEGTQLVADLRANDSPYSFENGSDVYNLTVIGEDRLLFAARNSENARVLWVTDGTTAGTKLVKNINPGATDRAFLNFRPPVDEKKPQSIVTVDNLLYLSADDGKNGNELWISDGTTAGTKLVKDINPGFDYSEYTYGRGGKERRQGPPPPFGSSPDQLTEFNGKVFFSANDGVTGNELWVTDGTTAGTQLLIDLYPGNNDRLNRPNSSYPRNLIKFQDRLFFTADNGEVGSELWVTDGTTEGTRLVKDINPNNTPDDSGFAYSTSNARYFTEFDNKLFFTANNDEVGSELWVTDGTTEGTQLVKDINPKISYFGDSISAYGSRLNQFTEFAGRLYFSAFTEAEGQELWVTDGTTEGTQLVEDLRPGFNESYETSFPYDSDPKFLTVVEDKLFLVADNGATGRELFKLTVEDLNKEIPDVTDTEASSSTSVSEDGRGVSSSSRSSSSSSGSETSSSSSGSSAVNVAGSVTMIGGDGRDRLSGNSGDDFLDGNLGSDTLIGGQGADVFTLRARDGTDTITDFELGTDSLGLSSGLQFADLSFSGQSISLGDEVLANLDGVETTSLTASDFEVI